MQQRRDGGCGQEDTVISRIQGYDDINLIATNCVVLGWVPAERIGDPVFQGKQVGHANPLVQILFPWLQKIKDTRRIINTCPRVTCVEQDKSVTAGASDQSPTDKFDAQNNWEQLCKLLETPNRFGRLAEKEAGPSGTIIPFTIASDKYINLCARDQAGVTNAEENINHVAILPQVESGSPDLNELPLDATPARIDLLSGPAIGNKKVSSRGDCAWSS